MTTNNPIAITIDTVPASGSTMPSSRQPTLASPDTRLRSELKTTRRFSNVALGIVIGDLLVHFICWAAGVL